MIPQGSRQNGMAYWRAREEKERVRQRRPRSAADNLANEAKSGSGAAKGRDVHVGGTEAGGALDGTNSQWEGEREEVLLRFFRSSFLRWRKNLSPFVTGRDAESRTPGFLPNTRLLA